MNNKWRQIIVSQELLDRLKAQQAAMQRNHERGAIVVPSEYADKIPLHFVIASLLNEVDARRERSRRPRKPRSTVQP